MTETYTHYDAAGHYLQAQKLLSEVEAGTAADPALTVARAQVHATLATAGSPGAVKAVAEALEPSWSSWKMRGESSGQWVSPMTPTPRSSRARRGARGRRGGEDA